MQVLEKQIEREFCDLVARRRLPVFVLKLNPEGRTGIPDRLCALPKGQTIYIEFKRPGETPRDRQEHIHGILRKLNHDVQTFDNAEEAFKYVSRKVDT